MTWLLIGLLLLACLIALALCLLTLWRRVKVLGSSVAAAGEQIRPGMVAVIQTFGSTINVIVVYGLRFVRPSLTQCRAGIGDLKVRGHALAERQNGQFIDTGRGARRFRASGQQSARSFQLAAKALDFQRHALLHLSELPFRLTLFPFGDPQFGAPPASVVDRNSQPDARRPVAAKIIECREDSFRLRLLGEADREAGCRIEGGARQAHLLLADRHETLGRFHRGAALDRSGNETPDGFGAQLAE